MRTDAMNKMDARRILRAYKLRVTPSRLETVQALADVGVPISYSDLLARMGDLSFDQTTIYRTLVKLTEVGVCRIVTQAGRTALYALVDHNDEASQHRHPHFICNGCGTVACLSGTIVAADVSGNWEASVAAASVQLSGLCPSCRRQSSSSSEVADLPAPSCAVES